MCNLNANYSESAVFALDIGTRTVVGAVGVREAGTFRVLASETYEHEGRAIYNGQIHNISEVAHAVTTVRNRLEQKVGFPLGAAYIAAAGRALKTVKTEASREIPPDREIDGQLLQSIEIEAVRAAMEVIAEDVGPDRDMFDFVGYSPTGMYLDGYPISYLAGHRGSHIRVKLLVTFLPRAVVESLFAVMRRVGIIVAGLTLEPIAALNAVVSRENRQLNLALVDIGAGTSDIAITKDGNVFAYSMLTFAGDDVTDRICDNYLTDFRTGERMKRALYESCDDIAYTDIFDRESTAPHAEVYEVVLPVIKELAQKIAETILADNAQPPKAVIVIGGGCQLPEFEIRLAEALGIDANRVAIRNRKAVIGLECDTDAPWGPESVTPFGIAVGASLFGASGDTGGESYYAGHTTLRLNEKPVRLADNINYTVSDLLVATAFKPSRLIGGSGKSISFSINGEPRTVKGEAGSPAVIKVNGEPAGLDSPVKYGDDIIVVDAADGADARIFVGDLAPQVNAGTVTYCGIQYYIAPRALINGCDKPLSTEVRDGDCIELTTRTTVGMFISEYAPNETGAQYFVNGRRVEGSYELAPGDDIIVRQPKLSGPNVENASVQSGGLYVDNAAAQVEEAAAGVAEAAVEDASNSAEEAVIAEEAEDSAEEAVIIEEAEDSEEEAVIAEDAEDSEEEANITEITDESEEEAAVEYTEEITQEAAVEYTEEITQETDVSNIEESEEIAAVEDAERSEVEAAETTAENSEESVEEAAVEDAERSEEEAVVAEAAEAAADAGAADEKSAADAVLDFFLNGDPVAIPSRPSGLLLVDAFGYSGISGAESKGRLVLTINGGAARLTDAINAGDQIVIKWVCE